MEALAKLEVGVTPKGIQMIAQAKDATNKIWKVRIKTAAVAAMLMQGTQDDSENLENPAGGFGLGRTKSRCAPNQS